MSCTTQQCQVGFSVGPFSSGGAPTPTSAPGAGGLNGVQEEELTPSEMRSLEKDLVGPGIGPILSPWQTSLLRAYPAPPWELQLGSVGVTGENRRALHL